MQFNKHSRTSLWICVHTMLLVLIATSIHKPATIPPPAELNEIHVSNTQLVKKRVNCDIFIVMGNVARRQKWYSSVSTQELTLVAHLQAS